MAEEFDLHTPFDAPIRAREQREAAARKVADEFMRSPEFEQMVRDALQAASDGESL